MSVPTIRKIKCPKCGKELEVSVWEDINTDVPNAMEDIISGRLFEKECGFCGYKINLVYPILYQDRINKVSIYYVMKDKIEEAVKQASVMSRFGRYRVVASQSALREKARIFSLGLDDRIVELYKLFAGAEIEAQLNGKRINELFFNVSDGEYKLAIAADDGKSYLFDVNKESLDTMAEDITVKNILRSSEEMCVIDSQWVRDMMTRKIYEEV